jgi:hypothetical protein
VELSTHLANAEVVYEAPSYAKARVVEQDYLNRVKVSITLTVCI